VFWENGKSFNIFGDLCWDGFESPDTAFADIGARSPFPKSVNF
jgi:hypothetical protein